MSKQFVVFGTIACTIGLIIAGASAANADERPSAHSAHAASSNDHQQGRQHYRYEEGDHSDHSDHSGHTSDHSLSAPAQPAPDKAEVEPLTPQAPMPTQEPSIGTPSHVTVPSTTDDHNGQKNCAHAPAVTPIVPAAPAVTPTVPAAPVIAPSAPTAPVTTKLVTQVVAHKAPASTTSVLAFTGVDLTPAWRLILALMSGGVLLQLIKVQGQRRRIAQGYLQ